MTQFSLFTHDKGNRDMACFSGGQFADRFRDRVLAFGVFQAGIESVDNAYSCQGSIATIGNFDFELDLLTDLRSVGPRQW